MGPTSTSRPIAEHVQILLHAPMVPAQTAWERYVLVAIVWFFVIAVLTGPVERWLRTRKTRDFPRSKPRW